MHKDVFQYCQACDSCQQIEILIQSNIREDSIAKSFEIGSVENQEHFGLESIYGGIHRGRFHHRITRNKFCKGHQGNHDRVLFHPTCQIDAKRRERVHPYP
jgi:hypothetical protein